MQGKLSTLKIQELEKLSPTMDWIIFDTDPRLKEKSIDVTEITQDDLTIISRMVSYVDSCYDNTCSKHKIRPGIAVAAPQMGLFKKIIYIHFDDDKEYKYLLANPEIIAKSQVFSFVNGGEGCLSVAKDQKGNIPRNYKIIVRAIDLFTGEIVEISAVELLSICFQHEIDHLDGILYTDKINKEKPLYIDPKWLVVK
ncbi:MAG: peptide deformylase [Mycoplasma sp.]